MKTITEHFIISVGDQKTAENVRSVLRTALRSVAGPQMWTTGPGPVPVDIEVREEDELWNVYMTGDDLGPDSEWVTMCILHTLLLRGAADLASVEASKTGAPKFSMRLYRDEQLLFHDANADRRVLEENVDDFLTGLEHSPKMSGGIEVELWNDSSGRRIYRILESSYRALRASKKEVTR